LTHVQARLPEGLEADSFLLPQEVAFSPFFFLFDLKRFENQFVLYIDVRLHLVAICCDTHYAMTKFVRLESNVIRV